MKRKHLLYLVACAILFSSTACSNDDLIEETELVSETQIEHPHRIMANLNLKDYNVNIDMVKGYLRLTKRIDDMRSITPLTIDQDTLAWAVQYQKGWQVLSGDSRMAPVMISCEEGNFDLKELSSNTNSLNGLLYFIRDTHYGTDTIKDRLWEFLETSELSTSPKKGPHRIGGEIATRGMWVEQDTYYESTLTTIPHVIQTNWNQGSIIEWNFYNGPYDYNMYYNAFTMTFDGKHSPAGCTAVAAGQIIYHYRKNNPRNISLPQDGYVYGDNTPPVLYNYSTNAWSLIETPYSPDGGVKYTALFLSWLGNMMNLEYHLSGTEGSRQKTIHAFDSCKLDFNETTGYNYYTISSELSNGRPIYIVAGAENSGDTTHAFIIDSKKIYEEFAYVSYLWDNDYEVSWEEYNRLDPWRFEMPDEYDPYENNEVYCEHIITHSQDISFAMNWGGNSIYNNLYYNVYHYISDFIDEAGYYPPVINVYQPYWAAIHHNFDSVRYFFHHFREL